MSKIGCFVFQPEVAIVEQFLGFDRGLGVACEANFSWFMLILTVKIPCREWYEDFAVNYSNKQCSYAF